MKRRIRDCLVRVSSAPKSASSAFPFFPGDPTMIPIDFSGKVALVTGVGDNESFAWFISKALKAAGAKVVLACHPRVVGIVESFLTRDVDRDARLLPDGTELAV